MELDIGATNGAVLAVEDAANMIKKSLDGCEWADPVHESFYAVVSDFSEVNRSFEQACDEIKTVASQVTEVDVKKLESTLESLLSDMSEEKK